MNNQDRKLDSGKPHVMRGVVLKFPRAMMEIAKASDLGCIKYDVDWDDKNYQASSYRRYLDPIGRHLIAHEVSPINTEYGGSLPLEGMQVLHLAQAAWSCLAALENYLIENDVNDLYFVDSYGDIK